MILYIDTASAEEIELALEKNGKIVAKKKVSAPRSQAEKLLPAISRLLRGARASLNDLEKIAVNNRGGSFTSLRIGVLTANALAYALGIPVEPQEKSGKNPKKFGLHAIVEPIYDRLPDIGRPKKTPK